MSLLRSYLESNAILSAADLEVAARHQQAQGGSLDTALLELGLLTAAQLDAHLSKACGLPTVPARLLETGPTRPWSLVPRALVDIGWAMPLALEDGHVLVAVHPDLPDARLGQLYRQIRGFMPMVAPECCLAKLAAERSGGIVAPRHAMLLLDMLEALEARDTRDIPLGVPQIAGSQSAAPLPDPPTPARAPAPQGPASQAPLQDPRARAPQETTARRPLADTSARRPVDAAPRAPLPDLENSFREPPADSAAATVVLPVAPADAAESLSATIIRPAATDDPSSSGSYPISAAFNAASSGSFAAAHDSGSFPISNSGSFPDLRSVGAQSSRRSADARAALPPSERRATPVPSDTRAATPAGPATPVPSDTRTTTPAGPATATPVPPDSRTTTPAGPASATPVPPDSRINSPASATPVPPDSRITAPGGPSSARGSGPSPAAVAPSPTAPGGPSSARGSGPSPAAVAPTPADPRGRLADTRPLPAAWETRGPLAASPGPSDSQTHARDTDPGTSLSAPIAHDPGRAERLAERMAPALATLAQARERDRITEAIVQAAIQIAPRVALFGVKREGLRALAAPGSALQLATNVVIPVPEASLLERAVLGQIRLKLLTEPKLAAAVGRPLGIPCLFEPVYAQDRGVLMLYIDRDGGLFDVADHNAARQLCDLARGSLEALLRLMGLAGSRSAGVVVDSGLVRVGTGPAVAADAKHPTSEATTAATPREPEPTLPPVGDRPRLEPEPRERSGRASKRQVIALVNPIRRDSGPNPTRDPSQSALTPVPEDSSITRSEHPSDPTTAAAIASTPAATETTAPPVAADAPIAAPVPSDSPTAPVPSDSPTAPAPTDAPIATPIATAPAPVSVLHVPNLVAPPGARRIAGKKGERARIGNEPGHVVPTDLRRPDAPTNPPTTLSIPTSLIAPAPLPGAKRRGSKTGLHPVPPRADEITLNMPRLVRSEARSSEPAGLTPGADADAQRGPPVATTPSNLSPETAQTTATPSDLSPETSQTTATPSDLSPETSEPATRGPAATPSDLSPETAEPAAGGPAATPSDLSPETAEPTAGGPAATPSDLSPETAEPTASTPAAAPSDLSPGPPKSPRPQRPVPRDSQ
ncbi:DUF2949 domain-containing protein [Nannocystis sp.]|uniref:DUF2949 domain-containing protein n=1 Tax=Nannocystis sp. TaxID=1962667 RepID=UPI0025F6371E|nr:DUF2949 domain-containing protein [Nannocystis sp.]MBK7825999.1 DUF2949 domain-containing protein [Nannocystis sp.]